MSSVPDPDTSLLVAVEARLDRPAWRVLGVARNASIGEACEAYATLVRALRPLVDHPKTSHRARKAISGLRAVFHGFVQNARFRR